MAIETFTWIPDDEASCDGEMRLRKSSMGDGYVQVSSDGLNPDSQTWALTFGGLAEEVALPLAFIRRHGGYRAFLWTPPGGELGLYRCEAYQSQRRPAGITVLSLTFVRAYHP